MAPPSLTKGVSRSMPDVSSVGLYSSHPARHRLPEATFTPMAAGLRTPDPPPVGPQLDLQGMLSMALSNILVAGLQDASQVPHSGLAQSVVLSQPTHRSRSPHQRETDSSGGSDQAEEFPEDLEFSEDEGLVPDAPAFIGLFCPALFRSLLHKARLTTNLGAVRVQSATSQPETGLHDALFKQAKQEKDYIPCPQLFADVLQTPWGQPGSLTTPSNLDKKVYCPAPELEALLDLPTVDAPVAALASPSVISSDPLDVLKSEDRRAELAFRKSHQAVAWAVRKRQPHRFLTMRPLSGFVNCKKGFRWRKPGCIKTLIRSSRPLNIQPTLL